MDSGVRRNDGELLGVRDESGSGASFRIMLPIRQPAADAA